ncbi:hypothetical protein WJX73_006035 [Symbiochloris irregularis]|uniref:BZIP domain-containing protein n=1 Tax=Symbiochloris irregularis TaxID=706552 RepID=A0AAW1NVA8_9CHLO
MQSDEQQPTSSGPPQQPQQPQRPLTVLELLQLVPVSTDAPEPDPDSAHRLPGSTLHDTSQELPWAWSGYATLQSNQEAAQEEQAQESTPDTSEARARKVDKRRGLRPSQHGRDKANQAQQRYRIRMKEQDKGTQQQVAELQERLQKLEVDNRQMAARQRAMSSLIQKQEFHLHSLMNLPEVAQLERNLLLEELATVVTHARGSPASVQEARQWTLLQWTSQLFPMYIKKLENLLPHAFYCPEGPEAAELTMLVLMRRSSEARRSMYVQLHSVLLAWNIDKACQLPQSTWPTPALWQEVLVGLKFSEEQQAQVLEIREQVLMWLTKAAEARTEAYALFPTQLLTSEAAAVEVAAAPEVTSAVAALRNALELERRAAGYLFWLMFTEVLTPLQEAWLDAGPVLKPWSIDMWALTNALAAQRGLPPAPALESLQQVPPHVQPYMPKFTGYQVLTVPALAEGAGTQLKRGMLCCWYLTTGRPHPSHGNPLVLPTHLTALENWTLYDLQSIPLPAD